MAESPAEQVRVLLVVDDDVFDRLGSMVRHLCVGMIDEAVQVTILARSLAAVSDDAVGPARVVSLSQGRWFWQRLSAEEVLRLIGGNRPQIVHCLSAELARWVFRWAAQWDSTLMTHLTDLEDVRRLSGLVASPRTVAVAATASIEQALLNAYPVMEDRVRVVPVGIPAETEPVCLAQPERIPAVVVTTQLSKHCGLDTVFKALRSIVRNGQEVQLFVLATGPAERAFRRQAQQLGLRSHVTFAGQMRDWATLGKAMRAADFYIVPGPHRRFTVSVLTAMAGGMAVLAPAETIEDYLIDGQTASLFDPLRPSQLAKKWAALLKDHTAARKLAAGALDYVKAHHQASMMVEATANFYRHLCASGPGRSST